MVGGRMREIQQGPAGIEYRLHSRGDGTDSADEIHDFFR